MTTKHSLYSGILFLAALGNSALAQVPDTAPTAPSNIAAVAYSSTAGEVSWGRSADDYGVVGYEVVRDGVVTDVRDTLSVVEFDLQPDTTYLYEITAIDTIGQRSETVTAALITPSGLPVKPPAPALLEARVYSTTAAELFWDRATDTDLEYEIRQDGQLVASTAGVSYFTAALDPGTSYRFSVTAVDPEGSRSDSIEVQLKTRDTRDTTQDQDQNQDQDPALNPPQNLRADLYSSTALELFWAREEEPAPDYEIARNGEAVARTDGISYYDDSLKPGSSYVYTVTALGADGQRSPPSTVSIQTPDNDLDQTEDPGPSDPLNPYLTPDPDGTGSLARLGYPVVRDTLTDLVSAGFLANYYAVESPISDTLSSLPHADDLTRNCPEGGTAVGRMAFFDFDVMFNDCRTIDVTFNGRLKSEREFNVFGTGSSLFETLTFSGFHMEYGDGESLLLNGTSERRDLRAADTSPSCGGELTINRQIDVQLNNTVWQTSDFRYEIEGLIWSQSYQSTPGTPVDGGDCVDVETLISTGSALVSSDRFLPNEQPVSIKRAVSERNDPREDLPLTGTASFSALLGDSSSLQITASSINDGEVQVDILDNEAATSFADQYRFGQIATIPTILGD